MFVIMYFDRPMQHITESTKIRGPFSSSEGARNHLTGEGFIQCVEEDKTTFHNYHRLSISNPSMARILPLE